MERRSPTVLPRSFRRKPDWEALPEKTPWRIQDLLRRCLQKDLRDRLRDIGDAGIEVREALSEPVGTTLLRGEAPVRRSSWRQVLPWALVGITIIVALTVALIDSGEAPAQSQTMHFLIPPPETLSFMHHIRISPDGRQIVFDGHDETGSPLWVQKLDSLGSPIAQRLDGTDPGGRAFWSPDSRFIGVLAEGKLKKIDPSGGPAVSLADVPDGGAGTWNRQGTILFSERRGPIHRVSAAGGEATAITELDQSRQEASHRHPYTSYPMVAIFCMWPGPR